MTKSSPKAGLKFQYRWDISNQGIFRNFTKPEEISAFLEAEVQFYDKISSITDETLLIDGTNYGGLNFHRHISIYLGTLIKEVKANSLSNVQAYLDNAQALQVLVGQGEMGKRVINLVQNGDTQEAKWLVMLMSGSITKRLNGQIAAAIAPYRAAVFAIPTVRSFGNIISTDAASATAKEALENSVRASDELEAFIKDKSDLFSELEDLYRSKLTLEEPAVTWRRIASEKRNVWIFWLLCFAALVIAPVAAGLYHWTAISDAITRLATPSNGGFSFAGLATITIPALFYAWLLKNVSRIFIQNLNLSDDAAHRRSLALTYLGLLKDEKHPTTDAERAIILNALFRPIPPQTNDEGPPAGLIDFVKKGGSN